MFILPYMKYEKRNYDTYNFIRRYLHEDALRNFLIESKLAKHALPKKNTIIRVYETTTKKYYGSEQSCL